MMNFKKIVAVASAIALMVSLSACHPKNEVAMTAKFDGKKESVKITSAQYLYALTMATQSARSNIDQSNEGKTIKNYAKYKVVETNGKGKKIKKDYYKWIENEAETSIKSYAAIMLKKQELGLKVDKATLDNAKNTATQYWSYYYQPTFEDNGVGVDTFSAMMTEPDLYKDKYFHYLYDTKGKTPVKESVIKKEFYDNYCLANTLSVNVKTESTESSQATTTSESDNSLTLKEAKKLLKGYKAELEKGTSFDKIYKEYQAKYGSSDESSQGTDAGYATVYGSADTQDSNDNYDEVSKLKNNKVKIIVSGDNSQVFLVQKQDISKDEDTYYKQYRDKALYLVKGDEFTEALDKLVKKVKLSKDTFATDRLKSKKIKIPVASEESSTAQQ